MTTESTAGARSHDDRLASAQRESREASPLPGEHAAAIERLQQLIRIPTVSRSDESDTDWAPFRRFLEVLPELYPLVHAKLERELVANYSMIYRWRGREDGNPGVLMAHYDVVAATDDGWQHPPFSAHVSGSADDAVMWGRGTLDDKGSLAAILEAVEASLSEGFTPKNDIYLCFGHNEETAGDGARQIVDLLEARGIRPGFVSDEGGAIVEGIFPGVDDPIAVVGVAEKGIMTLTMTVDQDGGHASTPPRQTATVRLARAIVALNRTPFPGRFTATNIEMIRTLGAHARGPLRFAFTQLWLTKPLLLSLFGRLSDETRAITRTTQAVTMLQGAAAENALAERATAVVNIRVAVGSSVAEAVAHVKKAVNDERVSIAVERPSEPSIVSPTTGPAWNLVRTSIERTYPGTIVTPYVMLGASDSRHFTRISDFVYRFSPFEMSADERGTLHAKNERIRISTWLRGIDFYREIVAGL
ncbi:M20/M25/M40 family metallo-hydrolase [Salinibacterium hongtaonis]|uniref:M20/M25/M40 family metallo-hydrolase n=1 Tax=Homoserinimonas hongtaonis TaxID=2079791 RepID=UPI001E32EABD|nr:M20/M25/M40 family metallo-hydrolase [Salinibacterium hongtaonis]